MNVQFYGDGFNASNFGVKGEDELSGPSANLTPIGDPLPMDSAMMQDSPAGAMYDNSNHPNDPVAGMSPLYEPPVRDIPVVGTPYTPLVEEKIAEPTNHPVDEYKTPALKETTPNVAPNRPAVEPAAALLNHEDSMQFRSHWNEIQATFVDEPRVAVQQADALVTEIVEKITTMFASQHTTLDSQWNQGNEVSTEDLRKALQQYRAFFNRLVV